VADLVTHVCVVLLPGSLVRSPLVVVAAAGAALPDLLGRAVPMALDGARRAGAPIPEAAVWPWVGLHEPFGWILVSIVIGQLFVRAHRWRVVVALWAGAAVHTLLDLLQDHHGQGYLLLAPFSVRSFELGWIGSEATVSWSVPLAIATAAAWLLRAVGARLLGRSRAG
jgi:hypothetical protein